MRLPHPATLKFLFRLTSDGCITNHEVWEIAQFLNKNSEARNTWPGDVLFGVLQQVFHDGELSESELRLIALTIGEIESECGIAYRESSESSGFAIEPFPAVPRLKQKCDVSSINTDAVYSVDPFLHACSCPDWIERRQTFPIGSPGRVCKHIARLLAQQIAVVDYQNPLQIFLLGIIFAERGPKPTSEWHVIRTIKCCYVFGLGEEEWVDVYALDPQLTGVMRFGWNRQSKRWAYGESPTNPRDFRNGFKEITS